MNQCHTIFMKRTAPDPVIVGRAAWIAAYAVPHVPTDRRACIKAIAYEIAARRGFAPGHELEDWLAAECEVDARLIGEGRAF